MPDLHDLTPDDFRKMFGAEKLPPATLSLIGELDFRHKVLTGERREAALLRAAKALDADLEVSGGHRQGRWEEGWRENLTEFVSSGYDPATLVPKFVKRNEIVRLCGEYVQPVSETFETNFVTVLRDYLFRTYFSGVGSVFEFGCGTGHNLVQLAGMFPDLDLVGLDWARASLEILHLLREKAGLRIEGRLFDLFHPDETLILPERSGVFTIGTLEQIGAQAEPFIRFLLARRPAIVVHVETLYELYDQDSLHDYVAARYLLKRNYLRGLVPLLKRLEAEGKIEILALRRSFGSFYHDGYSFLAWRPVGG